MRIAQPNPWRAGADSYRIYAGPIEYDRIRDLGVGLEAAVELGFRWIRPISQLLLKFMQFLNKFIHNYGVIIIIVSLLAKLVFWPLTERSMRSMRRMAELQPRMEEIRRRYKDDPKAMNEQVMLMYREQKVNPVGGCMPILIQTRCSSRCSRCCRAISSCATHRSSPGSTTWPGRTCCTSCR